MSLSAWLLRKDGFNPCHLVGKHRLHLMRLQVHLNLHLLLQGLNLGRVLLVIVLDSGLQAGLSMAQLLHLGFKQLQPMILVIDVHLV